MKRRGRDGEKNEKRERTDREDREISEQEQQEPCRAMERAQDPAAAVPGPKGGGRRSSYKLRKCCEKMEDKSSRGEISHQRTHSTGTTKVTSGGSLESRGLS